MTTMISPREAHGVRSPPASCPPSRSTARPTSPSTARSATRFAKRSWSEGPARGSACPRREPAGISQCGWMNLSADGRSYAYAYFRALTNIFIAEGLE
jgi:hypothetical protein